MHLNNTSINEELLREIKKYFEMNRCENATYQNLQVAAKAVIRGTFITLSARLENKNIKSKIKTFT